MRRSELYHPESCIAHGGRSTCFCRSNVSYMESYCEHRSSVVSTNGEVHLSRRFNPKAVDGRPRGQSGGVRISYRPLPRGARAQVPEFGIISCRYVGLASSLGYGVWYG